jgi:Flp pilus assembly protein TadD
MRAASRDTLCALALALLTVVVYSGTLRCGFVNFDDGTYVEQNPHVRTGLTAGNASWAWTTFHASNWHPLTWLSLQLDAWLFGQRPLGFHLTNTLLHGANAALLFLALRSLTGWVVRSAWVAAFFAVHPLRVESVAWVSERKDVLSAFFGLVSLWAYARYARAPGLLRYLLVVAPLVLSLLSKPMLVTLPFLLLVQDWWPLGRAQSFRGWRLLMVEKLPLLALCVASSVVTLIAQKTGGSVAALDHLPLVARAQNAAVAYATYVWLTVWPLRLTPYYPLPQGGWSVWSVAISWLLLIAVTAVAVWQRHRRPYLLAGWLWFIGTLVPMVGLVQVGDQAYADRYTYFPLIGLVLAIVWAVAEIPHRGVKRIALAAGATLLTTFAGLTFIQIGYWKDSLALWEHNVEVSGHTQKSLNNRGEAYLRLGRFDDAAADFREAVRRDPGSAAARSNLAAALLRQRNLEEARRQLETAALLEPQFFKNPVARSKLGAVLWLMGRDEEAMAYLRDAAKLGPDEPTVRYNLGLALSDQGSYGEAAEEFAAALRLDGRSLVYRLAFAAALDRGGMDATPLVRQVAANDPLWAEHVARSAHDLADASGAVPRDGLHAAEVLRLACKYSGGGNPELYQGLAAAYARAGRSAEAVAAAERGLAVAKSAYKPEAAAAIADWLANYRKTHVLDGRPSGE